MSGRRGAFGHRYIVVVIVIPCTGWWPFGHRDIVVRVVCEIKSDHEYPKVVLAGTYLLARCRPRQACVLFKGLRTACQKMEEKDSRRSTYGMPGGGTP